MTTTDRSEGDLDPTDAAIDSVLAVLGDLDRVIVGFSGGVDSAVLADLAHEALGDRAVIATAVSPSLPARDRELAREVARARGWHHVEVETTELDNPRYAENPTDRCFYCRQNFFETLQPLLERFGGGHIAVGTLSDDVGDHRPGELAADRFAVIRPLRDHGVDKATVRRIAQRRGIPVWDKPASACLSSRIPYGTPVTAEALARIERAEDALHDLGVEVCRVRDHEGCARVEVPDDQLAEVIARRAEISAAVRSAGYHWVSIDLDGFRSGSMNAVIAAKPVAEPVAVVSKR